MIHGIIKGEPCETLGPNLLCADWQNPRNQGKFIDGVRMLRRGPDGLIGEYGGSEWLLLFCDGCLESIVGKLLPSNGMILDI